MQNSLNEPRPEAKGEQLTLLEPAEGDPGMPVQPTPMATAVAKSIRSRRYKQGSNPVQPLLLPPSIDDYVSADNPVRAIKAYVDTLDFGKLAFKNAVGELKAGQPAFDPADLLELYLYGYLNRVRSSRRLQAECMRNLEVIWLLNGLRPGYHTIADFRKDNAEALKAVNSDFVQLCRELGLFGGKVIGIDGSFFNGNASHASVKTKKQLQAELSAIRRDIERYQQELNDNDVAETDRPDDAASAEQLAALEALAQQNRQQQEAMSDEPAENAGGVPLSGAEPAHQSERDSNEPVETSPPGDAASAEQPTALEALAERNKAQQEAMSDEPADKAGGVPLSGTEAEDKPERGTNEPVDADPLDDSAATAEKLAALEARAHEKAKQIEQLEKRGETQISRTDPDARRLTKQGKTVTGFNVQTVVDDLHKLILAHEVTNAGNDLGQLVPMIKKAQDALTAGIAQALGRQPAGPLDDWLKVLADAGYYTEADIAACEALPLIAYVPIPDGHRAVAAQGRLPGSDFQYDASRDVYVCPGGQTLTPVGKPAAKNGTLRQRYTSTGTQCRACPQRGHCLPKKMPIRTIYRSEHADAVECHRERMADASDKMRQRAGLCEHPFGTMKRWLGWDHFLVRGFRKVRGEMALLVHCYNFRRVLNILGMDGFMAYCEARKLRRETGNGNPGLFRLFIALFRHPQRPYRPFSREAGVLSSLKISVQQCALRFLRCSDRILEPAEYQF